MRELDEMLRLQEHADANGTNDISDTDQYMDALEAIEETSRRQLAQDAGDWDELFDLADDVGGNGEAAGDEAYNDASGSRLPRNAP